MINGKLVKNNSNKLVIVFQSRGQIPDNIMDDILVNRINKDEIAKYHKKYNWYTISEDSDADYLFIEDFFSGCYGWYMIDSGECIIEDFNNSLTEFIIKHYYHEIIAFGSSKGGTGALLYGLINPMIKKVFALVPQIRVVSYIEKHMKRYWTLFFPTHSPEIESYINEIFFNELTYEKILNHNKDIYLYTGVGDEQFEESMRLHQLLSQKILKSNIIINISFKGHNPLVLDNLPFIESTLNMKSECG